MKTGQIHVQTENIFPIIKKFLYSDHEIFLRELVSNAVDASQKLNVLAKNGEFKGTCASQSPFLNKEGITCNLCGKTVDSTSSCAIPDNEVDKVMAKFK